METAPPLPTQRPRALVVCGVINLVYAGFLLFTFLSALILMAMPNAAASNPVLKLLHDDPTYGIFYYASQGAGVLSLTLLVLSGIGLFKGREWARKLTLAWAVFAVVLAFASTAIQMKYLPEIMDQMPAAMPHNAPPGTEQTFKNTMKVMMFVGFGLGLLVGLAYPVAAWIVLTRPRVRGYCRRDVQA